MDDIKAKQQVVEKIKEASKILVTVSNSPSVDALSAALGLTLLFDKQEKYATAIFSGEVPPAIAFLEPEKTFDETTDSLRDFIIALNKEKADHLRYKVEGDAVKIFITPYKTTISQDDLEFSQGDYNVELVIALGVDSQEHLDKALEDHGQILHDATVITVSAGDKTSDLGGIDWHDANASSLSEMVSGLAEALKEDKKSLVDASIATALLTGIVAETERFSNEHTTSKAMTVAAQLMSAGADQQLIATELQTPTPEVEEVPEESIDTSEDNAKEDVSIKKDELTINHDALDETLAELDERVRAKSKEAEEALEAPQEEEVAVVASALEQPVEEPAPEPIAEPVPEEVPSTPEEPTQATDKPDESLASDVVANVYALDEEEGEPSLGGTLNATSEQAADDARREAMSGQNKTILSHAYLGDQAGQVSNPLGQRPAGFPGTPAVAPGSVGINEVEEGAKSAYAPDDDEISAQNSAPTFGASGEKVVEPLAVAPAPAVAVPPAPADLGLPLPPPLPDFSQGPLAPPPSMPSVFPSALDTPAAPQPEILGDILAPEPSNAYAPEPPTAPASEPPQTPSTDPGQFKIPS